MTMSAENVARAQEMRDEGISYVKIGKALGVGGSTVQYQLDASYREERAAYREEHKAQSEAWHAANKEKRDLYHAEYRASHREEAKAASAAYRIENPEAVRASQAAYRAVPEHREASRAHAEAYNATHKKEQAEWQKADRAANPEKYKKIEAARYAANSEELKEASRKYKAMDRAKWRAYSREYSKQHLSDGAAWSAKRRALKAGTLIGATAAQLAEIKEIYRRAKEDENIRCYLCGKKVPLGERHVDHVRALANGGAHRASNLGVTCASCNLGKGAKTLEQMGLLL